MGAEVRHVCAKQGEQGWHTVRRNDKLAYFLYYNSDIVLHFDVWQSSWMKTQVMWMVCKRQGFDACWVKKKKMMRLFICDSLCMVGSASKLRRIRIELIVELGKRITLLLLVRRKVLIVFALIKDESVSRFLVSTARMRQTFVIRARTTFKRRWQVHAGVVRLLVDVQQIHTDERDKEATQERYHRCCTSVEALEKQHRSKNR